MTDHRNDLSIILFEAETLLVAFYASDVSAMTYDKQRKVLGLLFRGDKDFRFYAGVEPTIFESFMKML